ncbi:MAG: 5'/3'-nucleotidase SurE [Bacteroidales bacterium]
MKTKDKKPVILVTNDDGVNAKGIQSLVEAVRGLGKILVVAPDSARSGQSGAITPNKPLDLIKVREEEDLVVYQTNGTPVDCVKLAMHELIDGKPDLLVSGINHGSNAAVSILYSGTMGAVLEGCVMGVDSIGFSLCNFDKDADFTHSVNYARTIVTDVLQRGIQRGICLNVNIPDVDEVKGIRVCRQAAGYWAKEFERRVGEEGQDGYWLTGFFHNLEPEAEDTDEWALREGFVSVVPCRIDMTAHRFIAEFAYMQELKS